MKKLMITCLIMSFDVFAGPQHFIIPRVRETNRMGTLYSREFPSRNSNNYDSLRNFENSRGGASFRRSRETEIRKRCFQSGDRDACEYVREYL